MMRQMPKLVTLDSTNTLIKIARPVGESYAAILRKHGITLDPSVLERNNVWSRHVVNKQFPLYGWGTEMCSRRWWSLVVRKTMEISCEESADMRRLDEALDFIDDDLYEFYSNGSAYKIISHGTCFLDYLRSRGIRLAVVSNSDKRLLNILEELQLNEYFDLIAISDIVKLAKPSPEMFRFVLRKLDTQARHAMHVGDSLPKDAVAALDVGMEAALLDGSIGSLIPPDDLNGFVRTPNLLQLLNYFKLSWP